jgi:hypothetical protein
VLADPGSDYCIIFDHRGPIYCIFLNGKKPEWTFCAFVAALNASTLNVLARFLRCE